jgi:hypothetical protein
VVSSTHFARQRFRGWRVPTSLLGYALAASSVSHKPRSGQSSVVGNLDFEDASRITLARQMSVMVGVSPQQKAGFNSAGQPLLDCSCQW